MSHQNSSGAPQFTLGHFRPLYLWGGPGTIRMTKLKFMNAAVDEKSHQMVHSIDGAERVAAMGFNWVFLIYNWGFPPEIEAQDWESFQSALNHYHQAGIKVFGYIQASNCVYQGSYVNKDWYARDAWGSKIPIYTGRYFTSLCHAGWLAEVRDRVRKLADIGADGIFFDNPWQGGIGIDVAEMPLGFIGSYDQHSQSAYAAAFGGTEIPVVLDTRSATTKQYLRWRTQLAANALRDWVQAARDVRPDILITANTFDPIVHNSYVSMGIDLEQMADVEDVMMIEDFSLPRVQDDGSVVSNAITIEAVRSRSNSTPVATNPYINGVGFDRVFQTRQLKRMLAEGAALNAPVAVRGSTFLYRDEYTTLLHRRYEKQHAALRKMNTWLESNTDWLNTRTAVSPLAVYHPYKAARWEWNRISPLFFAACQIILQHGLPLRIVGDEDWQDVKTLIVPPGDIDGLDERLQKFVEDGGQLVTLGSPRPSIESTHIWHKWRPIPHRIPHIRRLRKAINQGAAFSWRLYHRSRFIRWLAEKLDLHLQTTRSPLFFKPQEKYERALLKSIDINQFPQVESEEPVLLSGWVEPDGTQQWHIVNYANVSQKITLDMRNLVRAQLYSMGADDPPAEIVGSALMMTVDIGKVIRIPPSNE